MIGGPNSGTADVDVYRFDVDVGVYDIDFTITPASLNLVGLEVDIYGYAGQQLFYGDSNKPATMSYQGSAATDVIYVVVRGGSKGNPLVTQDGWTNYGSIGEYTLELDAIRTASATLTATGTAPVIVSAPDAQTLASTGIGAFISQVSATDADAGDAITFSIVEGNTGGAFEIDSSTGMITLASSSEYYTQNYYDLVVAATDSEGLINYAQVGVALTANAVHDESVDSELSDDHTSPTVLNFTVGDNTIRGDVGQNGQSGGLNGDGDYFEYTVPVGYEISKIVIDYNTFDFFAGFRCAQRLDSDFSVEGSVAGSDYTTLEHGDDPEAVVLTNLDITDAYSNLGTLKLPISEA